MQNRPGVGGSPEIPKVGGLGYALAPRGVLELTAREHLVGDPDVVRELLNVEVGRLRRVIGCGAWIGQILAASGMNTRFGASQRP